MFKFKSRCPRTGSKRENNQKNSLDDLKRYTPKVFFALLLAFPTHAQSVYGIIRGAIQSEKGEALRGISIQLEGSAFGTFSQDDGWFELRKIPAGKYTLLVSSIGRESKRESVEVKAGAVTDLEYQLNIRTNELSEVTVAATRRSAFTSVNKIDVQLRDMPVTTSSVSVKTIEQRGIDDLQEAMKNTTGVRANNTYGGFQDFVIRGFSNFVLLVDGVRDERHNISTSAPSTNLANVESIEVLKGPASVLLAIRRWVAL